MTAIGEGPALAHNLLQQFDPKIIAVTFPPNFFVQRGEERIYPRIPPKVQAFFDGVGIKVVTGRLPFDQIEGALAHNEQMRLIRDVLGVFGGSFSLSIQAVLQACDVGAVEIGEQVVAIAGDSASLMTASTTAKFLSRQGGLAVNEIFCKPRNLNVIRGTTTPVAAESGDLFKGKLLAPSVISSKALPHEGGQKE